MGPPAVSVICSSNSLSVGDVEASCRSSRTTAFATVVFPTPGARTGSSSRHESRPRSARGRPSPRSYGGSGQQSRRGGDRRRTLFRRVSRLGRSRCGYISRRPSVPDGNYPTEWALKHRLASSLTRSDCTLASPLRVIDADEVRSTMVLSK